MSVATHSANASANRNKSSKVRESGFCLLVDNGGAASKGFAEGASGMVHFARKAAGEFLLVIRRSLN